jgi:hypothetical protein
LAVLDNNKSSQQWFPRQKQMILDLLIYFLNEAGEILTEERFKPYEKRLIADGESRVDGNFTVVSMPENENDLAEWMQLPTEYDAVLSLALTTPTPQLCIQFIQLRDSQQKFDI